jgi:hypothetical protein
VDIVDIWELSNVHNQSRLTHRLGYSPSAEQSTARIKLLRLAFLLSSISFCCRNAAASSRSAVIRSFFGVVARTEDACDLSGSVSFDKKMKSRLRLVSCGLCVLHVTFPLPFARGVSASHDLTTEADSARIIV